MAINHWFPLLNNGPTHNVADAFYCQWLWHAITILADGNVTCGLDDLFGMRSFGNVQTQSVKEIISSTALNSLRSNLLSGIRCKTCNLYSRVDDTNRSLLTPSPYPKRAVIESTIRCNIRCRNAVCDVNNDRTFHGRKEDYLRLETFCKVIDEIGPYLESLYFFNYGEPFLNPHALDMLMYSRRMNSKMHIATSTNGILLGKRKAEYIVENTLLDNVCFTIGGCDQNSYEKYHKQGVFAEAFAGMKNITDAKKYLKKERPFVHWRYLLFHWNDSDEHIEKARSLASELGVNALTFHLTEVPLDGRSVLRAPGSPGFDKIADSVEYEYHYSPDPYSEAGLYGPELSSQLGEYCWTGRIARVEVPLADQVILRLAGIGPGWGVKQPAVHIKTPWEERIARVGQGEWAENPLFVPRDRPLRSFVVELRADHVWVPYRYGITMICANLAS